MQKYVFLKSSFVNTRNQITIRAYQSENYRSRRRKRRGRRNENKRIKREEEEEEKQLL